ncbi:MAG: acyl-CoA dehydrogenase family protein [Thermodesulfobacteriota bacterium]|nr:acyl-CoA dehydrogenase family protein [Thermodesulfobacteriota bacterium]
MEYEFTQAEKQAIEETEKIAGQVFADAGRTATPEARRGLVQSLAKALAPTNYMKAGLCDDTPFDAAAMGAMIAVSGNGPGFFIAFETGVRQMGRLIAEYGNKDQQDRFLAPLQKGELIGTVALCEKTMNVVNDPLATQGVRKAGGVVVSGEKGFVVNGGAADLFAVVGRLEEGLGVFLVERGAKGVILNPVLDNSDYGQLSSCRMVLEGCEIPETHVIGPVAGEKLLADLRMWENQVLIAAAVGMMNAALFSATLFAKTHRTGGKPAIAFQEVGFKLAEMFTLVETSQLMAYKTGWLNAEKERETEVFTDCAKVFCTESAEDVAGSALRILSLEGLAPDHPAQAALRWAKYAQIAGTSTEIARMHIGDAAL